MIIFFTHHFHSKNRTAFGVFLLLLLLSYVSTSPHQDENAKNVCIHITQFPENPSSDLINHITIEAIDTATIVSFLPMQINIEETTTELKTILNQMQNNCQGKNYKMNMNTVKRVLALTKKLTQAMFTYRQNINIKINEISLNNRYVSSVLRKDITQELQKASAKLTEQILRQNDNMVKWENIQRKIKEMTIKRTAQTLPLAHSSKRGSSAQLQGEQGTREQLPKRFRTTPAILQWPTSFAHWPQTMLPRPMQTMLPRPMQTILPRLMQTMLPRRMQTMLPRPMQTMRPRRMQTMLPRPMQTMRPRPMQTMRPRPAQTMVPPYTYPYPYSSIYPESHHPLQDPLHPPPSYSSQFPTPIPIPFGLQPRQRPSLPWRSWETTGEQVQNQPSIQASTSTAETTQQLTQQYPRPHIGPPFPYNWRLPLLSQRQMQPIFQPISQPTSQQISKQPQYQPQQIIEIISSESQQSVSSQKPSKQSQQMPQSFPQLTYQTFQSSYSSQFLTPCYLRFLKINDSGYYLLENFQKQKKSFQKVKESIENNFIDLPSLTFKYKKYKKKYDSLQQSGQKIFLQTTSTINKYYKYKRKVTLLQRMLSFQQGYLFMLKNLLQKVRNSFQQICMRNNFQWKSRFNIFQNDVVKLYKRVVDYKVPSLQNPQYQMLLHPLPYPRPNYKMPIHNSVDKVIRLIYFQQSSKKHMPSIYRFLKDGLRKTLRKQSGMSFGQFINQQKMKLAKVGQIYKECKEQGKAVMSKLRIMIDKGEMVEISRQFLETLIERSTLIRRLQTGINWCKMIKDIFIMQRKNVWRKIFKDNALGKLLKDLFQDIEKMITQFKELEKSLFKVWVDKY